MSSIILLNKPFQVLSQFTDGEARSTLAHFIDTKRFPGYYPAGRLDYDSEGLLLLCNDGALQHRISHPKHKLRKHYWVQVEGKPSASAIEALRHGVELKDGLTAPSQAALISSPEVWPREPPIRQRKHTPTHWIDLSITEGRNRQVRRMTASVGLPTLRLIRYKIGDWALVGLQPGEYRIENTHTPTNRTHRGTRK